jgi:hypothetical protein
LPGWSFESAHSIASVAHFIASSRKPQQGRRSEIFTSKVEEWGFVK